MAALSPSNTQRWYYTYENGINQHQFVIRGQDGATLAEADALVGDLLSAIGGLFHEGTFISVDHSAEGSNLRFPVVSDRIGDTFGSGAATPDTDAQAGGFVGRSLGGRPARLFLFGYKDVISAYRLSVGENSAVAAAVGVLNGSPSLPCAIDQFDVTWKSYMNIKPNDYWVKQARG